jgi:hypothetical protein
VRRNATEWTTYRTRFLIKARQLEEPLAFIDCLGREHAGQAGDYLVQTSDGAWRITPREIFEDVYVPIEQPGDDWGGALPPQPGLAATLLVEAQRLNLRITAPLPMSASDPRPGSGEDVGPADQTIPAGRRFLAWGP